MFASPSHSEDQRGLRLVAALIAEVLDLVFIALSQIVKPQTISFRVHDGEQFGLQHLALGSVQHMPKTDTARLLAERAVSQLRTACAALAALKL